MSKKLSGIISVFCSAAIAASCLFSFQTPVNAAVVEEEPVGATIGDVDHDGRVSIADATKLQKLLAGIGELDPFTSFLSDVNFDGVVSIQDVTTIQYYLAGVYNCFAGIRAKELKMASYGVADEKDIRLSFGNYYDAVNPADIKIFEVGIV